MVGADGRRDMVVEVGRALTCRVWKWKRKRTGSGSEAACCWAEMLATSGLREPGRPKRPRPRHSSIVSRVQPGGT